ncbi:hypothetical protein [Nonomuraea sp. NPDC002799]
MGGLSTSASGRAGATAAARSSASAVPAAVTLHRPAGELAALQSLFPGTHPAA